MIEYKIGQLAYLLSSTSNSKQLVRIIKINRINPTYTVELLEAKEASETITFLYAYSWQLQPVDILY